MPKVITRQHLLNIKESTVLILRFDRLGDVIACEPVIRWAAQKYPQHKICFAVGEASYPVIKAHPSLDYITYLLTHDDVRALAISLPQNFTVIELNVNVTSAKSHSGLMKKVSSKFAVPVTSCNYYFWGGLLGALCKAAGLPKLHEGPKYFFPDDVKQHRPSEEYVVFHTGSRDPNRDWLPEYWDVLMEYFFKKNIAVVEIGWTPTLVSDNQLFHDLTYVHELNEIASIISTAKCFFGIDSGFAHMANALGVDGVCLLGELERNGTKYNHHVPYTGAYAKNHIVRAPRGTPVSNLSPEKVIEFYEKKDHAWSVCKENLKEKFISNIYNVFFRIIK